MNRTSHTRTRLRFERLELRQMLSSTPLYALNVGGPTRTVEGVTWLADTTPNSGFTANFAAALATTGSTNDPIDTSDPSVALTGRANALLDPSALTLDPHDFTAPDAVFATWRTDQAGGQNLEYHFAVAPGKYRVDLYFAEPVAMAPGTRRFAVQVEGATRLDQFDLYAEAGGKNVAVGRSLVVDSNAQLDLALVNQTGESIVQAIRITEASTDVDRSFNPTTFTATNISQIQAGDVVELQPGTYRPTSAVLDALLDNSTAQRKHITLRGVPGQTILDFRDQPTVEWIAFDKWVQGYNHHYEGLTLDGLTFLNAGVSVNRGHGLILQNSIFDGYEGKTHPDQERLLSIWTTDDATITNNLLRWNNTSKNINAVGIGGGANGQFLGNKVEGLLRKALQFWKYTDGLIQHNAIERWAQTPGSGIGDVGPYTEDHGYYIHDSTQVQILSNTARGWSDSSSGNSVKIKNVDHVEVASNHFFTSGIIGRVETAVVNPRFEHVWIHDNTLHRGQINIWTPTIPPTAVRIENNFVPHQQISMVRDVVPALVNQVVDLGGGLPGGVFNNIAASYDFTPGIQAAGNTIHLAADFNGDRAVDGSDLLAWQRGFSTPALSAGITDGDANNDTQVDGADLGMWSVGYGSVASAVTFVAPIETLAMPLSSTTLEAAVPSLPTGIASAVLTETRSPYQALSHQETFPTAQPAHEYTTLDSQNLAATQSVVAGEAPATTAPPTATAENNPRDPFYDDFAQLTSGLEDRLR